MKSIHQLRNAVSGLAFMAVCGMAIPASAATMDYYGNSSSGTSYEAAADEGAHAGQPVEGQQGIQYVTGGIGDEERMTMEDMRHNYNLRLTNVDREGAFAGDTHVNLYNKKGEQLASVDSGPLFYAEVPAGKYTIVSTDANNVEKKKIVNVTSKKASEVTILW